MTLRWKLIAVLAVLVVFGAVGVYAIVADHYGVHSPAFLMDKQLKLGLDLKGGVHLVLRVQTDDALRLETEQEMERLRADLMTKGILTARIERTYRLHDAAQAHRDLEGRRTMGSVVLIP